jgi:hypothetical protein
LAVVVVVQTPLARLAVVAVVRQIVALQVVLHRQRNLHTQVMVLRRHQTAVVTQTVVVELLVQAPNTQVEQVALMIGLELL